jgi:hypothetical protein
MPEFMCESCGTRLYSAARSADLIDPDCPACGASADPIQAPHAGRVRLTALRTPRAAPIGMAPTGHQRVADRFGAFMERGRAAQTRLDAERWLDDGGSDDSIPAAPTRLELIS